MGKANTDEKELILISDIKGKKEFYFGKIAEMMEILLFNNNEWLKSVTLKKQIYDFENQKIIFMEIESENN